MECLRPLSLSARWQGIANAKVDDASLSTSAVPVGRDSGRRYEGEKPLRLTSRFESAHLPFSLAGRLMRDFGAVVGVSFSAVGDFA